MRSPDRDCHRLADIQAELFEKSITMSETSSDIFVRRFMNSNIAKEFDSGVFLEGNKTINDVFKEIEKQYGKSSYGSKKYHREVMYWSGYLYRHFCYCYQITSKQAYKYLPFPYVASSYEPYHTLDILKAIERLLEERNISFANDDINKKGLRLLRKNKIDENLILIKLSQKYKKQFMDMMNEWDDNKTPYSIFKNDYHDFDEYLKKLDVKKETGILVPDTTFFAYDQRRDIFVGAVNIRLSLNKPLSIYGGHIGIGIKPNERNKGYGTKALKLALDKCQELGINDILITCDEDNIPSKKMIISNGGQLENEVYMDDKLIQRYWINLSKN